MDLFLDTLPVRARRRATMGTLLTSIFIYAVLAWFGAKSAYQPWLFDDVTMSPPHLKTWPAGAAITLGSSSSASIPSCSASSWCAWSRSG
ncbi:MAG: hypothetical protein AB7F22_04580 [Reyranella sp.]|uniref:hypothetical protein n=1 Tax=Reyranella sp. TaxID=1929291 RepID=UPI003D0FFEF8